MRLLRQDAAPELSARREDAVLGVDAVRVAPALVTTVDRAAVEDVIVNPETTPYPVPVDPDGG